MAPSLDGLKSFIDGVTEQEIRSEELKAMGNTADGNALEKEWEGASSMNTLFLSVDAFVKMD